MPQRLPLLGKKFGRLKVIKDSGNCSDGRALWLCECDCGSEKLIRGRSLTAGVVNSCGCLQRDRVKRACTTHGLHKRPEYNCWYQMIRRCTDKYWRSEDYLGRGITVFPPWKDSLTGLRDFVAHIGPRPSLDYTIDRIDNNGSYVPGNVRWATKKEQTANRRKRARIDQFSIKELEAELLKRQTK